MEEVLSKLKELVGKKHVQLAERGNDAIKIALELAEHQGRNKVLIPDQGGWLYFKKAPKKFGMEIIEVKTDDGLIDLEDLEKKADDKSILLTCSMPGYFVLDNIEEIFKVCGQKGCLLMNDVSGSIGLDVSKVGHLVVGSFGKWKPLDLEYGGFIATDEDSFYEDFDGSYFDEHKYEDLLKKFEELPARLQMFADRRKQVIQDLQSFSIVHKDKDGINVVVKFNDEDIKQRIINYCEDNKLEYTLCPRYIRLESDAISIEIKRLT